MALRVPLTLLLAPIGCVDDPLDLTRVSGEFESMTELDAWLARSNDSAEGGVEPNESSISSSR